MICCTIVLSSPSIVLFTNGFRVYLFKKLDFFICKISSAIDHDINTGWSPLHEAACKGYLDVCKMLIKSGAEVNVHGYCDETPLHDAAFNNHPKVSSIE